MSLDQLEKKLYKPGGKEELEKEREERSEYNPRLSSKSGFDAPPETNWKELPPGFFKKNKKVIIIGGIAFFLILAGIAGVVAYQRSKNIFDREKVELSIDGPTAITSGDTVSYALKYKNGTPTGLDNVEISIMVPKELSNIKLKTISPDGTEQETDFSKNIKIGIIRSGQGGTIEIKGRLIAPEKSIHYLEAVLLFKPANISSRFEVSDKFSTTVRDIPLQFSLNAPPQVGSGEELSYTFDIINNTENELSDIEVKWELPEDFVIGKSNPSFDKDNVIKIALLKPKEGKQIKIEGKLSGNIDEIKVVKVTFGQTQNGEFVKYGEEQSPTKIASSYLTITQTVNESVSYKASPGEKLNFKIAYKNNTNLGIGELTVRAKLEENLLDFKTLNGKGGSFDAVAGIITWRGTDAPGLIVLSPGRQEEISFSINVKSQLPINNFNDKNFVTKSIAEIESREVPTQLRVNKISQSNETTVKINSKLILQTKAYYDEPNGFIKNNGPVPPKINQETTYTIHWRIINLTNDVENVKLASSLPPNVRWTKQTTTNNDTNILYNEGSNEIIWNIGKVPANTGIISPTIEGIFQVALTPAPNQIGSSPNILNPSAVNGSDTFTEVMLDSKTEAVNTEIPDDIKYKNKGEVVE